MTSPAVPLYDRLPEIYRQRDAEQQPPGQLQAYLALVEDVFGALHADIGALYRDLFIETCSPWVIPYIGDLLGVSVLSGDPWTLRADVADTIELRRMKGTLHAIELLAFDLTRWPAHGVELREVLAWHQHLNHQRPDVQSTRPELAGVARGGTVPIRNPQLLSLLGTPFDPFARHPDLKRLAPGVLRPNLPGLAIYLWRLSAFQAPATMPFYRGQVALAPATPDLASIAARFDIDPAGLPRQLFNTARIAPDAQPPVLSDIDQVPGPIPAARLTSGSALGVPAEYVDVNVYDATASDLASVVVTQVGLQFHLPQANFAGDIWRLRGANLCAWEAPLAPPLGNREIAIDPRIGRAVFGVVNAPEATALADALLVTFAYGAPGPVGAHPVATALPAPWSDPGVQRRNVQRRQDPLALQHALDDLDSATGPVLVAIEDSLTHVLDLAAVAGTRVENGVASLALAFPLAIVAVSGNRPSIRLKTPLAFRPREVTASGGETQVDVDARVATLDVLLQGLALTPDGAGLPALVARAAVARLDIDGCTLDPGCALRLDGTPGPVLTSLSLDDRFGFADPGEYVDFKITPQVAIARSITGPLLMEALYALALQDSIVDAGAPPGFAGVPGVAVGSAADPVLGHGPPLAFQQCTFFGLVRPRSASGGGGVFAQALDVWNNQVGCIRQSSFAAAANRLPQNFACVTGATVAFTDVEWNRPGYGQLASRSDPRVLEGGPGDDRMGAFGFLLEAHRWRNLTVRLREFVPPGTRPELIAVT